MVALEIPPEKLNIENREMLFLELYKRAFPAIARFVKTRNGSLQDAKDVFHDGLIILYEKLTEGKRHVDVSYDAYLMGIVKHLWARKFKDEVVRLSMTATESLIEVPDDFSCEVNEHKLLHCLEQAGDKCLQILTDFYYHHASMQKIMKKFTFTSERSTTVQKFKCLEKIRDVV